MRLEAKRFENYSQEMVINRRRLEVNVRKMPGGSHIRHAVAKQTFENLDLCLSRNEISDFTKVSKAPKRVPRL